MVRHRQPRFSSSTVLTVARLNCLNSCGCGLVFRVGSTFFWCPKWNILSLANDCHYLSGASPFKMLPLFQLTRCWPAKLISPRFFFTDCGRDYGHNNKMEGLINWKKGGNFPQLCTQLTSVVWPRWVVEGQLCCRLFVQFSARKINALQFSCKL